MDKHRTSLRWSHNAGVYFTRCSACAWSSPLWRGPWPDIDILDTRLFALTEGHVHENYPDGYLQEADQVALLWRLNQ